MTKQTSFTQGKILQPLILFAFPVLLALFLQAMYGAVDLLIVGKFGFYRFTDHGHIDEFSQQFCDGLNDSSWSADWSW